MIRFLPFLLLPALTFCRSDCSTTQYRKCVQIADPLVKEARLVFPDNVNDIDIVCDTWNKFVDCLKRYTEDCFTDEQRKQFNRAVESPIESVHQMCMQPTYQKEYLQYAPCIKNTIISKIHCGQRYDLLVDLVDQGDVISKSTLCCSHDRFKQCIETETRRLCDRGVENGPASRFASQILEKALGFLQDQCLNYIPSRGDCRKLTTETYNQREQQGFVITTPSSDVSPWSTVQEKTSKEVAIGQTRIPSMPTTTSSWLPSSNEPTGLQEGVSSTVTLPTQQLGSRTRPASYGRSSAWNDVTPTTGGNTVAMYHGATPTASSKPDWATVHSWDVQGQNPFESGNANKKNEFPSSSTNGYGTNGVWEPSVVPSTETTWYPAAGNQLSNEVDEPNQLGLQKPKNGAVILGTKLLVVFVVPILIFVRG